MDDLITALIREDFELVKKLISQGFPLDKTTSAGQTALIFASFKNYSEIVKILIDAGAKINIVDNIGNSALIFASSKCHKDVVQLLISAGANLDIKNKYGYTALIFAIIKNCKDIVKLLIDANVNLGIFNMTGQTPLIIASLLGHSEIVKMLIDAGADLNEIDFHGKTALTYAREENKKIVVEMLFKAGAITAEMVDVKIGKGSFGSVYDGAHKCIGHKVPVKCRNERCITKKLDNYGNFKSEVERARKIEQLDFDGQYHFPIRGSCPPSMIYYEKGEKTLESILSNISKIKSYDGYHEMMIKILRLFDGLVFFNRHNFVHCDIKEDNIVESIDGKIKYIDFGLSQDMNKFIPDIIFQQPIYFRPPEIIYLSVNEYYKFDEKFIQAYVDKYISYFQNKPILAKSGIWSKLGETDKDMLKKYLINIGGKLPKDISDKIDVFSLGILLVKIIHVAKLISEKGIDILIKLCQNMTKFNRDQRYTAEEAREYYKKYLDEI